jgi:hypothetical protein
VAITLTVKENAMATSTVTRERRHLRLVRPAAPEPQAFSSREVALASGAILAYIEQERARLLDAVGRMVAEQLEPLDPLEARRLLAELRSGELP